MSSSPPCFVCGASVAPANTYTMTCCGARAHVDCLHTAVNFGQLDACFVCHRLHGLKPFQECTRTLAAINLPWPCCECGGDTKRGAVICEGRFCFNPDNEESAWDASAKCFDCAKLTDETAVNAPPYICKRCA